MTSSEHNRAVDYAQAGLLAPLPPVGRYLMFSQRAAGDLPILLRTLAALADGVRTVVGLGPAVLEQTGAKIPGMREFPQYVCSVVVPSTPTDVWVWLRGDDTGDLFHRSRFLVERLAPWARLESAMDAFVHRGGRDLTGYEDGTENPKGDNIPETALVSPEMAESMPRGLVGSSFAVVQQWQHGFALWSQMSSKEKDLAIGRRISDNAELGDAPPSAHIKRTAQERFWPPAFILRRSMPWVEGEQGGLMFVAFSHSFNAFEAQLRRMVGLDDGVTDALFQFARPLTGAYFWCPPVQGGRLDLQALGI